MPVHVEVSGRSSNGSADAKEIPGPSAVWTDEKHQVYIHSLEASFVEQLQQSFALRGCLQKVDRRPCSSAQDSDCNSLQQITLRCSRKQRINCEANEDLLESTSDSHFTEGSPPMHHFVSETEHVASSDLQTAPGKDGKRMRNDELPVSSASTQSSDGPDEWCFGHRDPVNSFIEVSDQNFVDDDTNDQPSCASRSKRSKIGASNDHVIVLV